MQTEIRRKACVAGNARSPRMDSEEIMVFKSEKQFSAAFAEMNSLRRSEQLCDVVLEVANGDRVPAHRVVLASQSAYFRAMFTGEMSESKKRDVAINGLDGPSVTSLIDYAYTATIEISQENVQLILPAASVLQFEEVKEACSEFLRRQLDADNCLGIKVFAEVHGCSELQGAATVFSSHHFSQVRRKEEFLKLSLEEVKSFLSNDQLNVESEFEVYEAVMEWLERDRAKRYQHVYEVLVLVRLPLLTPEQLLKRVRTNSLILANPDCVELLMEALQCHMLPDTRSEVYQAPKYCMNVLIVYQSGSVAAWNIGEQECMIGVVCVPVELVLTTGRLCRSKGRRLRLWSMW